MVCRILRSNPHRGGVASRPGYREPGLRDETETREAERAPEGPRQPAEAQEQDGREEPTSAAELTGGGC